MLVLSHRGLRLGGAHENTLEAFERAANAGVDGIETDVRATRDGELVLIHDRLVPGDLPVQSLSRGELQRAVGHEVPTLQDAVDSWPDLFWCVEIKSLDAAEAARRFLQAREFPGGVLVISFRHDVVGSFAERTVLPCGILVTHRPLRASELLSSWVHRLRMRTVVWDYDFHDPQILEETRAAGYDNFIFGMQSVEEHRVCLSLPCQGMITDHPDLLAEKREESHG